MGRPVARAGRRGDRGERRRAWGIVSGAPSVTGAVSGAPPVRRAAGIHDLVMGSRIGGGWRRHGSLMTMKSKTRSERRKRRELVYIGEGPLVPAPNTARD